LLNNLIEVLNGPIDLLGAGVLFPTGRGDFLYQLRGFLNVRYDLLEQ